MLSRFFIALYIIVGLWGWFLVMDGGLSRIAISLTVIPLIIILLLHFICTGFSDVAAFFASDNCSRDSDSTEDDDYVDVDYQEIKDR